MRRLPLLSALPAFEATVRLGSVGAAAQELGRTHSAISKQLHRLSDDLGGALFEKKGTGIVPTEQASHFAGVVGSALDDLERAASTFSATVDDRHVDVTISATLAMRWLIPRLPRFYAMHPDVEIRLRMSGPISRTSDHGADVLLSYDRLRGPLHHENVRTLGDAAYGPVCAPSYSIEKHGERSVVPTRFVQPDAGEAWRNWSKLADIEVHSTEEVEQPHHVLALEAATAGLGLALAEKRLVENEIKTGRLIAPFGFVDFPGGFQAAVLVDPSDRSLVGVFLEWLASEATADQAACWSGKST